MTPPLEDALKLDAHRIAERIARLPYRERQMILEFVSRIEAGLKDYGPWPSPANDKRDLRQEAVEEALDLMAYTLGVAMALRDGAPTDREPRSMKFPWEE